MSQPIGYFTIPEFVEATGRVYRREWVRVLIQRGEIRAVQRRPGGNYRIPVSEVDRFLNKLEQPNPEAA